MFAFITFQVSAQSYSDGWNPLFILCTKLYSDNNSQMHSTLDCIVIYLPGVDFTKGFKTWHKFSTEIRFMLIPIIVLFIAHEFITGNF